MSFGSGLVLKVRSYEVQVFGAKWVFGVVGVPPLPSLSNLLLGRESCLEGQEGQEGREVRVNMDSVGGWDSFSLQFHILSPF